MAASAVERSCIQARSFPPCRRLRHLCRRARGARSWPRCPDSERASEPQGIRKRGSSFPGPTGLVRTVSGPLWSAQVNSCIPGEHRSGVSWEQARGPLELILSGLREAASPRGTLRPLRQWCGGPQWPAVVDRIIQPLDKAAKTAARRAVEEVLDAEAGVGTSLVHGDFGLHNIMWRGDQPSGVIDLDNACIGDPALDLAPLIGTFGSARVADIADRETIARAKIHRASLPLQVAAAAQLINDSKLKDFALANFQMRLHAGTLQDPHQT